VSRHGRSKRTGAGEEDRPAGGGERDEQPREASLDRWRRQRRRWPMRWVSRICRRPRPVARAYTQTQTGLFLSDPGNFGSLVSPCFFVVWPGPAASPAFWAPPHGDTCPSLGHKSADTCPSFCCKSNHQLRLVVPFSSCSVLLINTVLK
jgi:hypothetical protein